MVWSPHVPFRLTHVCCRHHVLASAFIKLDNVNVSAVCLRSIWNVCRLRSQPVDQLLWWTPANVVPVKVLWWLQEQRWCFTLAELSVSVTAPPLCSSRQQTLGHHHCCWSVISGLSHFVFIRCSYMSFCCRSVCSHTCGETLVLTSFNTAARCRAFIIESLAEAVVKGDHLNKLIQSYCGLYVSSVNSSWDYWWL